ncbi:rhodanese-like domain-containing protein [Heyndrickxia oleronia]|jgi:rhodanese-related sulfurtransferase|uniref:Rhodanese-like domain-containing protein n=1 Tax=Heyndrickxia oleronia TaxID=38875 RepID=A0A8E2I441_9BACI|nr:rhodanese-like domain-containing protein [Heyndrickxia oleronia]NYV64262.1 rhodanese-like domain-containing protein [Bacillus sp. Gen3]MCI1592156.1 rhodanese-like domain-containing protein [Heyndrickxia oleronia]MCI1612734.1 rhodanese-like domain-containing protein [Heyndrickxia oleronia]MCI1744008.1 rhodanese-like domain-containing protein [Heyndrickxia oleronia]MCI1760722.1 rhodanese-like domain-containing protein [Heyndrickxia oleronia]
MSEFPIITPDELKEKLEKGEKLNLIDVREADEVAEGMIPEAKHIPMGEIPESLDQLDQNVEYIMICRSGGRSARVCQFLQDNGYKVVNMEGGMLNWTGVTKPKL